MYAVIVYSWFRSCTETFAIYCHRASLLNTLILSMGNGVGETLSFFISDLPCRCHALRISRRTVMSMRLRVCIVMRQAYMLATQ